MASIVKLILLITLLFTHGQFECPSKCNCSSSSVLCIKKELKNIPYMNNLEVSPFILDFSGNNLVFISKEDFDFEANIDVKEIYLNKSNIGDIEPGVFDDLENLQELYLGDNLLNDIPEFLIEELPNMVLLDLSNNYFNGDMPRIRSISLEVFVLANSKISRIPDDSLMHLPKLKVLLLQQNDIKTLTLEAFQYYQPNLFFTKLSYNSWQCNCGTLEVFKQLELRNFIDSLEPYHCNNETNEMVNIFGPGGAISSMCKLEVRDMLNVPDIDIYKDAESDTEEINYDDLIGDNTEDCYQKYDQKSNDNFLKVIVISTVCVFWLGFLAGMFFCRILTGFRYQKLQQSSDSQVQLLYS